MKTITNGLTYGDTRIQNYVEDQLNFVLDKTDGYVRKARFLNVLGYIMFEYEQTSWALEFLKNLANTLQKVVSSKKGSMMLHLALYRLLDRKKDVAWLQTIDLSYYQRLFGELPSIDSIVDFKPFTVSGNRYCFDVGGPSYGFMFNNGDTPQGLYITDPNDYDSVTRIIEGKEILSNEDYAALTPFFRRLTEADVLVTSDSIREISKTDSRHAAYDFRQFVQQPTRGMVEKLFGISAADLCLPELYSFFDYLKFVDVRSISTLQTMIEQADSERYKVSLLKSFLSLQSGGLDMFPVISSLVGIHQEGARDIFDAYASAVDRAVVLTEKLRGACTNTQTSELSKLPIQLLHAFMERSKDLLIAAVQNIGREKVLQAISGVELLLDILNDFKIGNRFEWAKISSSETNARWNLRNIDTGYEYALKLFARPYAETHAQARINIEIEFDTNNPDVELQRAFVNTVTSRTQNKTKTSSVLRFGIDREVLVDGTAMVSVDFGRAYREDDELSRTGDVLGNLLSLVSATGHHTTTSLAGWVVAEENFAQVVRLFQEKVIAAADSPQ